MEVTTLKTWLCIIVLMPLAVLAQPNDEKADKVIDLQEVVVSAQIEPQSLKKAVQNVQVISSAQISRMGATTLADVLNQYLNITIRPDENTGKQTVSLFGLDAKYFKVLVDNVPLVGENGFGNNTDLSQVNLEDVERIEIVEGAMAVTHGANAVTGILNIITKRTTQQQWQLRYSLQEEAIGKEYNWVNKGKHLQNFKATAQLAKGWVASLGTNRTVFNGYYGEFKGKNYLKTDEKRGYKRSPYEMLQTSAMLSYQRKDFSLLYKFERMDNLFRFFDRTAETTYSPIYDEYTYGDDRRTKFMRNYHHLNLNGKEGLWRYNASFSYQYQEQEEDKFRYMIEYQQEIGHEKRKTQSMNVYYSTGYASRPFANKRYNLQVGYELTHNIGFSDIKNEGQTIKQVTKNVDNYDLYSVLEVNLTDKLSLRPGGRYSFQKLFDNQYAYSLSGWYLFGRNIEWRASAGQAYRTPSFEELYTRNIFSGHSFVGNENLLPERSLTFETNAKKTTVFDDKGSLTMVNNLALSYNNITNKIENALLDIENGTPSMQFINVSKYYNYNVITSHNFKINKCELSLGASLVWISQQMKTEKFYTDDRFLLNLNANLGVAYQFSPLFSAAAYYKFVGRAQRWVTTSTGYQVADTDPYGFVDASVQKLFLHKRLECSLGVRNLLNVVDINYTRTSLTGQTTTLNFPLSAGRSFYAKLTFNLNINH